MSHKLIKVGRDSSNDIVISDSSVSRFHLELFYDEEGNVFLTDLNSTNGTFVNGNRVKGSIKLQTYDIVKLGKSDPLKWNEYKSIPKKVEKEEFIEESPIVQNKKKPYLKIAFLVTLICGLLILLLYFLFRFSSVEKPKLKKEDKPEIVDPSKPNDDVESQPEKPANKKSKTIKYDYSCLNDENDLGSTKITEIFSDLESESLGSTGIKVSIEEEENVGAQLLEQCRSEYVFIQNGKKILNLETILKRLVKQIPNPRGFTYSIYLLESNELNAFTAGAKIFMTTAMYTFCKSNDELACIIAHEIYHNELGHIREQLQKEKLLGSDLAVLNQMLTISFGQKKELACDLHGIDLVILAGYNACVNSELWRRMQAVSQESGFDPMENMFRSHPYSEKRSSCSKHHIKTNYQFDCSTQ